MQWLYKEAVVFLDCFYAMFKYLYMIYFVQGQIQKKKKKLEILISLVLGSSPCLSHFWTLSSNHSEFITFHKGRIELKNKQAN